MFPFLVDDFELDLWGSNQRDRKRDSAEFVEGSWSSSNGTAMILPVGLCWLLTNCYKYKYQVYRLAIDIGGIE